MSILVTVVLTSAFWWAFYFLYKRPELRAKIEAELQDEYRALTKKKTP